MRLACLAQAGTGHWRQRPTSLAGLSGYSLFSLSMSSCTLSVADGVLVSASHHFPSNLRAHIFTLPERPIMLPLYLSSPGFNLVSMTSYTNFCFMLHLRFSAFFGENGSLRDGMAETFWFYSQNLPTVGLLLPRAGLSLAVLLAFSSPDAGIVALADAGISSHRDSTYFRSDGGLTSYARGVLIANAAWTAWRALIVLWSW